MNIFDEIESEVRSYARSFPCIFNRAQGVYLYDTEENAYLDFLSGAGTLNYGHNNPWLKTRLIEYIQSDGITHGLDLHTAAKAEFLHSFKTNILTPRGLEYVLQFTGPTGTNAVEAALKLARKIKKRENVICFTNGFHGVSMGALAATGNNFHRNVAGITLSGITRLPYDGYLGNGVDTTLYIDKVLTDPSSGIDLPAAVLVETVQGEGGINVASNKWLQHLAALCKKHDILLIVDDIQAGCGRTGKFFSFEEAGISPDIITLSKSLSGYGLPFSLVLIKPEFDKWEAGEHNGTFRGNNHAFVTAKAAIDYYWQDNRFASEISVKGALIYERLELIVARYPSQLSFQGRGMFIGINCQHTAIAKHITQNAFSKGLLIETCGSEQHVVKILCPLTIEVDELHKGLNIIDTCVTEAMANYKG